MSSSLADARNLERDIDTALVATRANYTARNGKSLEAFNRAARYLPGGTTRSGLFNSPFPVFIARGKDAHLWDIDGRRYIEFSPFALDVFLLGSLLVTAGLL